MENSVSSDQARTKWRELLDNVIAGERIVIERYGKPVAVIMPFQDYEASRQPVNEVREETAVYQTDEWQSIKAAILAELKEELLPRNRSQSDWRGGWQLLQDQVAQTGGSLVGLSKNEIVVQLQQTRKEIFEAEYAHLYR